jgi:hypothetical protein
MHWSKLKKHLEVHMLPGIYPLGDRLNFVLPDFLRLSWVSDHAREVWTPRLKRIVFAWGVMERESVLHRIRKCAVEKNSQPEGILADESSPRKFPVLKLDSGIDGVSATGSDGAALPSGQVSHFAIGDFHCVQELRSAWLAQDHNSTGRLLGYPPCCTQAFVERYANGNFTDPIWPTSSASSPAKEGFERQLDIDAGAPSCNIFWRSLGIRSVPHLPCRFDCEATAQLSRCFIDLAPRLGFAPEIEWLLQVLSWPVEWSALHGIAEIKTPILKISTATDATARKFTVCWIGNSYPNEGAQAIRFPYQTPHRLALTESPAYQRGLTEHSRLRVLPQQGHGKGPPVAQ